MNNDIHKDKRLEASDKVAKMQKYWEENDQDYHILITYLLPIMDEIGRDYPAEMWPELVLMNYKLIKQIIHDLFYSKTISGSHLISRDFH
jgi:hypothetical protein